MVSSFGMLLLLNAMGLVILTMLFIGYIRVVGKYTRTDGPNNNSNGNNPNNNDDGGGGFDPGLPKIDLPPGSGLSAWQTDRITTPLRVREPV